jgi:uncharacterized membrane protein
MRSSRFVRFVTAILCVLFVGAAFVAPAAVMAQDDEEEVTEEPVVIPDELLVNAKFPSMTGPADSTFKFEVEFTFRTGKKQGEDFDLTVSGPTGWLTYIAESSYKLDSQISAIHLEPYSVKQPVLVVAVAPFWLYPEPGDYPIEFRATSPDVDEVVDLTATITARYGVSAETTSGRLNTKTTAGKATTFNVKVTNSGTAVLDKVSLSSTKPSGIANEQWAVKFAPEKVEKLGPGEEQEVEVSITPPSKTIAGDYMVTLKFDGEPALSSAPPSLDIRVSVATKTAWGIIGAVIVVLVIGGLVWAFREFGRR